MVSQASSNEQQEWFNTFHLDWFNPLASFCRYLSRKAHVDNPRTKEQLYVSFST
jgi:hypothetical protein